MHRTFQSTLPREERLRAGSKSFSVAANFNPRSHERSDSASISCSPYSTYFNPRSHERSDRNWALTDSESIISIHAPTRGATLLCEISNPLLAFQSTLPREERPIEYLNAQSDVISIHAPTRGATFLSIPTQLCTQISIHAPTRGATTVIQLYVVFVLFQSTLPREERLLQVYIFSSAGAISIHAPTRGATFFAFSLSLTSQDFNPRSHERSDTAPEGLSAYILISIHAPTRGATNCGCFYSNRSCISIHAPTRGATITTTIASKSFLISIHAPTRGATITHRSRRLKKLLFQSTLPREERRNNWYW